MYRINRNREARAFLRGLGLIGLWIVMVIVSWALVIGAVTALFTMTAAPAAAESEYSPGPGCTKVEFDSPTSTFTMPVDGSLHLKAGQGIDSWPFIHAGTVVGATNGKDISHVIYCPGTNPNTTTTTAPVCHEDDPCWDCETMGNLVCGSPSTTTSTTTPTTTVTAMASSRTVTQSPPATPVPAAPQFTG